MNGVPELAAVTATIFEPDDQVMYQRLLGTERWLWWFQDPAANTVWDVLVNEEADELGYVQFSSRAIRFALTAISNPYSRYSDDPTSSYMGTVIVAGQEFVAEMFEGDADSIPALVAVALRNSAADHDNPFVQFLGVFDVVFDEYRNEDGGIDDTTCGAVFVGEFDLRGTLPMTTAALEWSILRLRPEGTLQAIWKQREQLRLSEKDGLARLIGSLDALVRADLLIRDTTSPIIQYRLSERGTEVADRHFPKPTDERSAS